MICQHVCRTEYSFWHFDFLLHDSTMPLITRRRRAWSLKVIPAMGKRMIRPCRHQPVVIKGFEREEGVGQRRPLELVAHGGFGGGCELTGPRRMTPLAEILSAVLYHLDLELQQSAWKLSHACSKNCTA